MTNVRRPHTVTTLADGSTKEEHESFGMIGFVRSQGGGQPLFGSHVPASSYFKLTIRPAVVEHDRNGEDRYYADRQDLIEVEMSALQFAELMTGIGQGYGVPCTITHVLGERLEPSPKVESETIHIQNTFQRKAQGVVDSLRDKSAKVKEILAKPSLSKADRGAIESVLQSTITEVSQNLPFMVKIFQEATAKTTHTAKAEVEAFIALSLRQLGLNSLKDRVLGSADTKVLELGAGDE